MRTRLRPKQLATLYDESREKVSALHREQLLNQRFREHIRLSYQNCDGVRELFRTADVSLHEIGSVKDLDKLPVMTKDDLAAFQRARPPYGGFLGVKKNGTGRIYLTPRPLFAVWGPERIEALVRDFLRVGYPRPGDLVLISQEYHLLPGGLALTDALDLMGCIVVPAGTGQIELQVGLLRDLNPAVVFGLTSFIMALIDKSEELGYDFRRDFQVKSVFGGNERHIQKVKSVLEQKYGLAVGDTYGTADVGPVGYCCGQGDGYHYDDESCVVEIADPNTGKQLGPLELGQIVVTPLSRTYPLVRFGTGDLASYTTEPCPCGRSAPRITAIRGSLDKHVRVKGKFIHLRDLHRVISAFPEITNYQMVISLSGHSDAAILEIEGTMGGISPALAGAINERCEGILKMRMDEIQVLPKDTLPTDCRRFVDRRWD